MKRMLAIMAALSLLAACPARAFFADENGDTLGGSMQEEYRLFREEKKRLSMERAVERGLLSQKDSRAAVSGKTSPAKAAAGPTAKSPAPKTAPPVDPRRALVVILLFLALVIVSGVMSFRYRMQRQQEAKRLREERKKQIHREIEARFRSYFPREI